MMRCAIYARAATSTGVDAQLLELRAYVERRGWQAVEYVDMGTTTRPQLAKLMKDARCLEFETVLVWRLDRWGRDLANCLASIEELCQLRIGWAAVGQGLDTDSPGAQLIRSVLTAVQAFVGETKSEHIKAGMRKAVKRTYVPSGRPKKVFDRERVHALHAEGKSIRAIAAELKVGRGTVERLLRVPKGS